MKYKSLPAAYKSPPFGAAADGDSAGFEAVISVFNNVDHVGDIVRPGAFKNTIAAWQKSGDTIPVLWSHRMDDPHFNIGGVKEIAELSAGDKRIPDWANPWIKEHGGLYIKAELDDSPMAEQVRRLLKARRVSEFSFAYDVNNPESKTDEGHNELLDLWLYEASVTPIGANPLTELIGAKTLPPDEPPPDEPLPETEPTQAKRRRPAALGRLHAMALQHEHTD